MGAAQAAPAGLFALPNASETPKLKSHPYVPGEILVRFEPGVSQAQARRVSLGRGGRAIEKRLMKGLYLVRTAPNPRAMEALMAALSLHAKVDHVTANYLGGGGFQPNDPSFPLQWHLEQPSGIDIGATEAWDIARGSSSIVIAVLDTGLKLNQPEFDGRVLFNPVEFPPDGVDDDGNGLVDDYQGWDFVDEDEIPDDLHGHGTWVTSLLAANTNNEFQVAGVDHFAKILPLRVLNAANLGTTSDLVEALTHVSQRSDVQIVNMSLMGYPLDKLIGDAISAAAVNSTLVACAGNMGPGSANSRYPGAHFQTLSVGWTDSTDVLAPDSSTGSSVSFTAPGVDVVAAHHQFPYLPSDNVVVSGCSMATPLVTGVGSLLYGLQPWLHRFEIETILAMSAVDLGAPGRDPSYGWGRIRAAEALEYYLENVQIFRDGFESGDTAAWSSVSP